jgi:hypothetical protein
MSEVRYFDSAGGGEIVRSYTTVCRRGGNLVFLDPRQNLLNWLDITKLGSAFAVFERQEDAIRYLAHGRVTAKCPVCQEAVTVLSHRSSPSVAIECRSCGGRVTLGQLRGMNPDPYQYVIQSIEWPTYEGESVALRPGAPSTISLPRRLDLFAFGSVELAWRTVPRPRRIVCRIRADSAAGVPSWLLNHPKLHDGMEAARRAIDDPQAVRVQMLLTLQDLA